QTCTTLILKRTPQKYDPTFKGPIHDRSCTDIICCILLVVAIVGYVIVGIVAWTHGDPRKVIYPTDSRGQFCGQLGTPNEYVSEISLPLKDGKGSWFAVTWEH
uniref:Choline transporter-like protein 2 n=1 Tax=Terrapene triunguis TaxID=2587831 RepID=A0A674KHK8_9SAUR